jgi:hypothetical protein
MKTKFIDLSVGTLFRTAEGNLLKKLPDSRRGSGQAEFVQVAKRPDLKGKTCCHPRNQWTFPA